MFPSKPSTPTYSNNPNYDPNYVSPQYDDGAVTDLSGEIALLLGGGGHRALGALARGSAGTALSATRFSVSLSADALEGSLATARAALPRFIPANYKISMQGMPMIGSGIKVEMKTADDLFDSTMRQIENREFSTERNMAVFYSGPGNRAKALSFSNRTGAPPIDMTPGGQFLESLKLYEKLPSHQADAIWARASQSYASAATGEINLFVYGARPDRVFHMFERPILKSNEEVYKWILHYP